MIRFIELTKTYEYVWEYKYDGWIRYNRTSLSGDNLIEWLQKYGIEPNEMFKGKDIYNGYSDKEVKMIDRYHLYKKAEEWAKNNQNIIDENPWTCVGMNGGYVLMSNGSKENTVELGSASAPMNLNIDNSNNVSNDVKVSAYSKSSLI